LLDMFSRRSKRAFGWRVKTSSSGNARAAK
jgi:hypothetical protein